MTQFTVVVGAALVGIGAFIAAHHPLSPVGAMSLVLGSAALGYWAPNLWLVVVLACVPVANLAPWTGWTVFEEFDLVVLGILAGRYLGFRKAPSPLIGERSNGWSRLWPTLLAALTLASLAKGLDGAGVHSMNWFDGYSDALNSVRIGKSTVFALLCLPPLRADAGASPDRLVRRFATGMVIGAALVSLAALYERIAYPGLLDFASHYRTTALFWEMNVGGAAIDAYLVMVVPFVVWRVWVATTPRQWTVAAILALVLAYACLTTYSRGAYLGVLGALTLLAWMRLRQRFEVSGRPRRWRRAGSAALALALAIEASAVLAPGSFMWSRFEEVPGDYGGRLEHWARGLRLLRTASQWIWGMGLGRLPERYASQSGHAEFSGEIRLPDDGSGGVVVSAAHTDARLSGLYALTQQVPLTSGYSVVFDARANRETDLLLSVCARHLLYADQCQWARAHIGTTETHAVIALKGADFTQGRPLIPRSGVFAVSALQAGAVVQLRGIRLFDAQGVNPILNGRFSDGLAHWQAVAQLYFVPWHIDNLALEVLLERGIAGLIAWAALVSMALRATVRGPVASAWAPYLCASMCGALLVGSVSSILDMPRVAFVFTLLLFMSLTWPDQRSTLRSGGGAREMSP